MGKLIESDPATRDILKIVYLEDYNVTKTEVLMPASDVSEQISLAGTEASGTGNMKFMLNGAITLGTLDGANVEINKEVGDENIVIFGMNTQQVKDLQNSGYQPQNYANQPDIARLLSQMEAGIGYNNFNDIAINLRTQDPYMVLADFDAYKSAQKKVASIYRDRMGFAKKSLINTSRAGAFAADRAIKQYADNIWGVKPL